VVPLVQGDGIQTGRSTIRSKRSASGSPQTRDNSYGGQFISTALQLKAEDQPDD